MMAQFNSGTQFQVHTLLHRGQIQKQQGLTINFLQEERKRESRNLAQTKTIPFSITILLLYTACNTYFLIGPTEEMLDTTNAHEEQRCAKNNHLVHEDARQRSTVSGPDETHHVCDTPF